MAARPSAPAGSRPGPKNLVILCADELRGDCPGYAGNPDVQTPHLDALVARGTAFLRHFTTFPKCVPARISLVTGRYPHTDGFRTITQHLPPEPPAAPEPSAGAPGRDGGLAGGYPNLLTRLKAAGYETALFGKNHCWDPATVGDSFDYTSARGVHRELAERMACTPYARGALIETGWDGITMADRLVHLGLANLHQKDDVKVAQAVDYLTRRRDRGRPFFLQVNIEAPHPMYAAEEPYFSRYDRWAIRPFPYDLPANAPLPLVKQREVRSGLDVPEAALREVQATYYGMVSKVDEQIGQLVGVLAAEGLLAETIILFWSDHGDFAGQYGLPEKWDTTFADCLTHVPCALVAPGDARVPVGARITALTDTTDLAPTLLELLGLPPLPGMHGHSLLPFLAGGAPPRAAVFAGGGHEDEMLSRFRPRPRTGTAARAHLGLATRRGAGKQETYARYPDTMARAKMVRTERWKLVTRRRGGNELYDMVADPWEQHNLWGAHRDSLRLSQVVLELQARLLDWCLRTDTDRPHQDYVEA